MKVGWFSTDFQFDPVVDPDASARSGRQVFRSGVKQATYGGTFHYRMALPALELRAHGYETVLSPAVRSAPDGHLMVFGVDQVWHDDCDVVVFQRWMKAGGDVMARRARAAGQIVIQDVDDNFWALPRTNVAHRATDGGQKGGGRVAARAATSDDFNRNHYRAMIAASSAVICSTPTIAGGLAQLGPPVFLCRNAIDIDRWAPHDPGRDGMIGWVGGVPWRGNDLPLLRDVLPGFLERYGLPFYHGGVSDDPRFPKAWEQLGIDVARVKVAGNPLVTIDRYPLLWEPVGLALVPLENSTFNRSKSWLKGLEAAACGVPFVASRLPEYEMLACGRLADSPAEWLAHLEDLLDPTVRRAEGVANRARAEELSIGRQWQQWDSVLREVTAAQPAAAIPAGMVVERPARRAPRRVRVAVGITTYNRPKYFARTAAAAAQHLGACADRVYIHDDGSAAKHRGEYRRAFAKLPDAVLQADGVNRGVAAAKNALLSAMLDDGAEWLFLLEDDILVRDELAVTGYIRACEQSGFQHLSFAHHGPANRGGPVDGEGAVEFYPHAVGAWCVYSREALETCGLMDTNFHNAWEHVEHSARLAAAGFTSGPYRWADAAGSRWWLAEQPGSIEASSIGASAVQQERIAAGLEYWRTEKPDTYAGLFGPGTPLERWALARIGVAA